MKRLRLIGFLIYVISFSLIGSILSLIDNKWTMGDLLRWIFVGAFTWVITEIFITGRKKSS